MKVIKLHATYLQTRWTYLHIHRYIYIKEWYKAEHTAVPYPLFKNIVSSIIHFFLSPSSHFTSKIYTNVHEEALQVEVTSSETILEIKYHEILKGGSFFLFFFFIFFPFRDASGGLEAADTYIVCCFFSSNIKALQAHSSFYEYTLFPHSFFFRFVVGLYLYISTEFISKLVMSNHNSSSLIHCKIESG